MFMGSRMFLLFRMLFWSGYQQRGARCYRECHTSKAVLSLPLTAEWLRGESGKEGAFQENFSKSCAGI